MDPHPESEVLCEGWMVKSPPLDAKPTPYSLYKPKWRRRWFVLQQGKLPRQYVLNYYVDDSKKRLKGTIPLDDCQQVEHGLVDRKGNYEYMFSINTSTRIYFLAVDTRTEMDTWVNMVCKACGLRDTSEEEEDSAKPSESSLTITAQVQGSSSQGGAALTSSRPPPPEPPIRLPPSNKERPVYQNTPNLSSSSSGNSVKPSISSPYIHISECFSGKVPPKPPPRFRSSESAGSNRHDSSTDEEQIYYHMPAVNTMDRNGKFIMIPANSYNSDIQYTDLDLDMPKNDDEVFSISRNSNNTSKNSNKVPHHPNNDDSSTIYKTVDMIATKALEVTRKDVEKNRRHDKAATVPRH